MKPYKLILATVAILFVAAATAQPLSYDTFMQRVGQHNAMLLAEQYNIDIAQANIQAARVFNDPELSLSYSNNQDHTMQMGQSFEGELSYNFSLGGVRGARIGVARTEHELSVAAVADFLRNLRAEAATAWGDAWRCGQTEQLMLASYQDMERIAQSDSVRYAVGEINQTDAMQSRLEAQAARNEWIQSRTDYRNSLAALAVYAGDQSIDDVELLPDISFDTAAVGDICATAERNRADLRVAELSQTLSQNNLRLVRATRAMEIGLSAGYAYNTEVRNQIAPAPAFRGFTVGISIPLKFSSFNKGERRAAEAAVSQNEAAYTAAQRQIRAEAQQAYNSFVAAQSQLATYSSSMIDNADRMLQNRTVGYSRGETGLIELLSARRTYNDVYRGYIDARCNAFTAEAALRSALGIQ